jgi:MbtH protein
MATNPFEDENGTYHVLINDEGQHSLWPTFIDVPDGWKIIHRSDTRSACLEFINKNWTDMRPNSLIAAMEGSSGREEEPATNESQGAGSEQPGDPTINAKTLH